MPAALPANLLPRIARTLLAGGYSIESCHRPANGAVLLKLRRVEILGGESRTVLLLTDTLSRSLSLALAQISDEEGGAPVIVSRDGKLKTECRQLSVARFFSLLGGELRTDRIFAPRLPEIMSALGHGRCPLGLVGQPDRLLEEITQDGFAYLMESPVRRYGQERAFERLPDAVVLGRNGYNVCLDTKAYRGSYHPSANDMRAFREYVTDFNSRYAEYVSSISVFVVISGSFSRSSKALENRANELLVEVRTPMVFMTARDVGLAVQVMRENGGLRRAIDWRRVFVPPVFALNRLHFELKRVANDGIV